MPTSGSRHSADIIPRQASIVLAGTGFGSMKRSLKRAKNFWCSLTRFRRLALEKKPDELSDFCWERDWSRDADHPDRADREKRQGQRIVAAQDSESIRRAADQLAHPVDASARFLDRDDIGIFFRQPNDRVGADVDAASPGNVIEHELERGCFGNGSEMAEESFLARLVVIGRDEKGAIDSDFLRFLCVDDRVAG